MALLKIDWSPEPRKIRQFGLGIIVFAAVLAAVAWWRGDPAAAKRIAVIGALLGAVTASAPPAGLWVYKAWMAVAFVIGTAVSYAALALVYFGIITPMALFFRLIGRDALRLKRPAAATYWIELPVPEDKSYFERLY